MSAPQPLVWLVTGCSSGFGLGIVRTALKAGHKVIASSRNPSKTPDLVKEVEQAGGKWIALDVTASEAKDVVKDAIAIHGRLDVLVNNAGYFELGAVEDTTPEDLKKQFETNLFGPIEMMRAVVPSMRENKAGCIVNISSSAGYSSGAGVAAYSASKFALEGISEGMGKEIAPFGINTLLVEPGFFRTHFLGNKETFDRSTSAPYKSGPVQGTYDFLLSHDNKQAGDPDRGAERIFELVTNTGMAKGKTLTWGQGGFQRTPLGKDAADGLKTKGEEFIKTAETYMELASASAHDD